MVKYLLLISGIVIIFSCKSPLRKQENKSKYFEGFVEFSLSYNAADPKYINNMRKVYGTKAITYLGKNGFFSREYIDANNIVTLREIYRPDSLRFYESLASGNTISCFDVTRPTPDFIFEGINKSNSLKILSHHVDELHAKMIEPHVKNDTGFVYASYFNDPRYPVDPLTYKRFVHESVEEIFSKSPYLTTGLKLQYSNKLSMFFVATRIVPSHIPSWHFEIPKNKTIVYQTK